MKLGGLVTSYYAFDHMLMLRDKSLNDYPIIEKVANDETSV